MDRFDESIMAALGAIAKIELREWPEGAPMYNFHEGFTSDIVNIKAFCRSKRIFGRSSKYMEERWDTVLYLSLPYFLYYLPSILLALLERPKGHLAGALVTGRFHREFELFSLQEQVAVNRVIDYLALYGITQEKGLERIEEGKRVLEAFRTS